MAVFSLYGKKRLLRISDCDHGDIIAAFPKRHFVEPFFIGEAGQCEPLVLGIGQEPVINVLQPVPASHAERPQIFSCRQYCIIWPFIVCSVIKEAVVVIEIVRADIFNGDPASKVVVQTEDGFQTERKIGSYGKIMLIVSPGDGRREQNVPFRQMDPFDLSMAGRKPQRQLSCFCCKKAFTSRS